MSETTIETLSGAQCWGVRCGGEWARFFVRHGMREARGVGQSGWIDLAIRSSFGDWAYGWTHCGPGDWRLFLADTEREYAMTKFMGAAYKVDDIDATVADARSFALSQRRQWEITREEAREAWDACEDAESADTLVAALEMLSQAEALSEECWELVRQNPSPAAVAFWDQLWTPWVAHLAREALSEARSVNEAADTMVEAADRLAKAEALAEAAKEVEQIVSSRLVVVRGVNGEPEEPGDNFTRDVIAPLLDLRAALSAFQQGGDGWRPIPEDDEDAETRGIEYPPSDVDLLLWSPPSWGHEEGITEVRFWRNSRSGSTHGDATHWRPLPAPPRTPS